MRPLGLDPTNHADYVAPSDYRDPILLDLRSRQIPPVPALWVDNRTLFVVHSDESAASDARQIANADAIEVAVHLNGSILVDLSSLLAAVYLLSLDWQIHESQVASTDRQNKPDVAALEQLAEAAIKKICGHQSSVRWKPVYFSCSEVNGPGREANLFHLETSFPDHRDCSRAWRLY
ncbi:putative Zn(2)-C6 fungal-type domain-containing protein [Seiridium cardinale]